MPDCTASDTCTYYKAHNSDPFWQAYLIKSYYCPMGEPGRRRSYSNDLRWRVVFQRKLQNLSYRTISENLTVAVSTVSRIIDRFDRTGDVRPSIMLHSHEEFVLLQMVMEKPSVYLREFQYGLEEITGTEVSVSTICRTLNRFGFSRKKLRHVALQRSDSLRSQYLILVCWSL